MLRYIEKCTGSSHTGPAWIGRVRLSKTGRTVYFNGKAFKRSTRAGGTGNYYDTDNGDPYWITGVKRDGEDRHWAGSGQIMIEASMVDQYLDAVGAAKLDPTKFRVVDVAPTDIPSFHERENRPSK